MNENKTGVSFPEYPDALDRKILALLQDDGRVPNAEIARATGASVPTVRKRIERMIENGVVQIVGLLDPAATGYPISVMVGVSVVAGDLREVARSFAVLDRVCWVGYCTGRYNLLVEAVFRGSEELLEFLSGPLAPGGSILSTEVFTILGSEKFKYMWEIPDDAAVDRKG